jgi:glycosyltransferase involved in cell wall biosynthesis
MHILFLPRLYPHKFDPMWGLFVKKHAEAVSKINTVSVLYIYPVDNYETHKTIINTKESGIETYYIYFNKPKIQIIYLIKFIYFYYASLIKINKRKRIDIIHVHVLTRMGFLAFLSKLTHKLNYVVTEHWSRYLPTVQTYNGTFRKLLTRFVVKNAKSIMPVTKNLEKAMINHKLYNENYTVIPNVVDELFFKAQNQHSTQVKRIIHVSTFINKSKNISGIIDAIQQISIEREDLKLILIGEGINYEEMKSKVNLMNLNKYIEFTGLLEKEALVHEFEKASFMLINSNYENMPVVINEAFATGLPVLSTNVGGISEHLNSDRGRLIEPGQPKQLVEQINWMLDHYQEFDAAQLKAYAKAHFSMEAIGKQLSTVYQEVLVK